MSDKDYSAVPSERWPTEPAPDYVQPVTALGLLIVALDTEATTWARIDALHRLEVILDGLGRELHEASTQPPTERNP